MASNEKELGKQMIVGLVVAVVVVVLLIIFRFLGRTNNAYTDIDSGVENGIMEYNGGNTTDYPTDGTY